jgi:hypothetical protein
MCPSDLTPLQSEREEQRGLEWEVKEEVAYLVPSLRWEEEPVMVVMSSVALAAQVQVGQEHMEALSQAVAELRGKETQEALVKEVLAVEMPFLPVVEGERGLPEARVARVMVAWAVLAYQTV